MVHYRLALLPLVTITLSCADPAPDSSARPGADSSTTAVPNTLQSGDTDLLLGKWEIVESLRDGAENPAELGGVVTFRRGEATVRTPDGETSEYRTILREDRQPKEIDWIMTRDGATWALQGLYEIDGDMLITCSPEAFGIPRPTALETKPGDHRFRFMLKRRLDP